MLAGEKSLMLLNLTEKPKRNKIARYPGLEGRLLTSSVLEVSDSLSKIQFSYNYEK